MEGFTQIIGMAAILSGSVYTMLILAFTMGWNRLRQGKKPGPLTPEPAISVVVAARNEESVIERLLDDLIRQDYPSSITEVIIVDDLSADLTAERITGFIEKHCLSNFRLIRREGASQAGSKKSALALGISQAGGEIILTTDADCRLPAGWIRAMAGQFRTGNVQMAAGPVAVKGYRGFFGRFQALEFLGLISSGAGAAGAGIPFLCNGACLAYRKKAFLAVQGYEGNERYASGDDVFLMHKIRREFSSDAIAFVLEREALVETDPEAGFRAFLRQRSRWASKSTGYRDTIALLTAFSVFLFSFVAVSAFVGGFFYPPCFLVFASIGVIKSFVDFPLLQRITRFTGNTELLYWLVPFEAIYPFYVMTAALAGFAGKWKWR